MNLICAPLNISLVKMSVKKEEVIDCGNLIPYLKDNSFFTHYWEIGNKFSKLEPNSEVCISEVLISRYFVHVEKEHFITFINYKEINKPFELRFPEGDNIIFYNDKYFLISEILKLKLEPGYYDSFEKFRTQLYLSFNEVFSNRSKHLTLKHKNGMKIEDVFTNLIRKKDDIFYYGNNPEMEYFRNLLLRMKYFNEQIVFESDRTDFCSEIKNQIQRVFFDPVLATNLGVLKDVMISSTYQNISSYKLDSSKLIDEIQISFDLSDNLNNVLTCYLESYRHSLHYIPPVRQYSKIVKPTPDKVNFLIFSESKVRALVHLKLHVQPIVEKKV